MKGTTLPLILDFKISEDRPNTYNITGKEKEGNDINYFVLKDPRNSRFKEQGAIKIAEMWSGGEKQLFTGLRPIPSIGNAFFGDRKEANGRRSLVIFITYSKDEIQIHYFKNFYPRKKQDRYRFKVSHCTELINAQG